MLIDAAQVRTKTRLVGRLAMSAPMENGVK
jgi:hypothetical protein